MADNIVNDFEANFELDNVQFDAIFEINPAGAAWGTITGRIEEQTDLINLLNEKVDISDFENLEQTVSDNSNNITLLLDAVNSYGDIVTYDAADFATKNQGLLANTALQPNDNITELVNNAGFITSADLPTVNNNTITLQKNGTNIDSFTLNQNTNKSINITVPTNTNELTNGAGFITSAVNDLTNYYLKSETYTKTEVQQLIASIPQFSVVIVQSLPVTGERMVLYLVPKQGEQPDVYNEYIWVEDENEFELLGSTAVDLDGYATETYVDNGLATKQNTLVSGTNIKTINNESILGSGNITIQGGGAVDSVNGQTGVVVLTASDIGALPNTTVIPTKTSDLTNDSGYITSSDLPTNYVTTDTTQTITGAKTFTNTTVVNLGTTSGASFTVKGSGSSQAFLLQRTNGATGTLEAGANVVLFGSRTNHPVHIRANYSTKMTINTDGSVILANAPDVSSNNNQVATTKWVNDKGYITGITSSDVETALGYVPYNSSNPNGYITSADLPTVNNPTITFTQGGVTKGTITLNQSNNQTIALDAGGSGGGGTWGSITGTLSDQTDLQNALNAKLNVSDVTEYTAAEVETLWGSI